MVNISEKIHSKVFSDIEDKVFWPEIVKNKVSLETMMFFYGFRSSIIFSVGNIYSITKNGRY